MLAYPVLQITAGNKKQQLKYLAFWKIHVGKKEKCETPVPGNPLLFLTDFYFTVLLFLMHKLTPRRKN